jgi:hypothetical protein
MADGVLKVGGTTFVPGAPTLGGENEAHLRQFKYSAAHEELQLLQYVRRHFRRDVKSSKSTGFFQIPRIVYSSDRVHRRSG